MILVSQNFLQSVQGGGSGDFALGTPLPNYWDLGVNGDHVGIGELGAVFRNLLWQVLWRRVDVGRRTAADTLLAALNAAKAAATSAAFHVVFLYYDCDTEGRALIRKDPHVPLALRACIRHFDLSSQSLSI